MSDAELARLRGVVVTRLDEQRRDDPDRPIRIVVAGVAFAELTEAEALTIAAALGAVMPDEAAKLRTEVASLGAKLDVVVDVYRNTQEKCDRLRKDRDALREQVADALALCTEIRPDSVIGTSDTDRLKAVRDRLAMPVGGGV